jgi:hypothetical protein
MKKKKFITAFAVAITCLTLNSSATPSTQIWIPSTDIQGFLNPHFGWDTYINAYGDGIIANGGITVGVLPFKKVQMEIGIDYRDISGAHSYPFYYNAKIGVPEEAFFPFQPAIAAGGYDFGTQVNATSYNIVYGLIAKIIWKLGRFPAGGFKGGVGVDPKSVFYVSSSLDQTARTYGKTDDSGVLLSWDRTMTEISDKLWLAVDFQSGKSGYGAFSFGASWAFAPNASVILGYDIFNDKDAIKPAVTAQIDFNLK